MTESAAKYSNSYKWNLDRPESFTFVTGTWDVLEAKQILASKRRKVQRMDLTEAQALVGMPGKFTIAVQINWKSIQENPTTFDLDFPIILVTTKHKALLPVDGWHRIARAKLEGMTILPCLVLNRNETKSIEW